MPELPIGSREQILAAADIQTAVVSVPEWGCALKVRGLTLGEVNAITNLATRRDGKLNVLAGSIWTFIRGVVEPKFTDEDFDALKAKSAVVLRVVKEINRLSGITPNADEALDDAEKN